MHIPASPLPNIIVIMADDMGMGDTSAYQFFTKNTDQQQIHTPAMERLARMGILFTDAHTPSTRCTPTRYSLLTGRYSWRNRLKHWVLFGSQGDPMIERDRPTLATMLKTRGYSTAVVGKWHVGLRYRKSDGSPASGWKDADLLQPLIDCPLDHGFDYSFITSRSHGTSGPNAENKGQRKDRNNEKQNIGPGHIHGRFAVAATGKGKLLNDNGPHAYELSKLGRRHAGHALDFISSHISDISISNSPFFLYYAFNSNHTPYTPDIEISGTPIKGASRNKLGEPMGLRSDFIFENDVALGKLTAFLEERDDPRNPGKKLIDNTIIIFTSDNGAEKNFKYATGPFRSNKGSCYEGGHRVPFIMSWPAGGVGNGLPSTPGVVSKALIGHQDLFATFSEIAGHSLPDLKSGRKGAEDSQSFYPSISLNTRARSFLFVNDHKESKGDPAALVLRYNDPEFNGEKFPGQWKIFFDSSLLRNGSALPVELYNLSDDQMEEKNLINQKDYSQLIGLLSQFAEKTRLSGGERLIDLDLNPATEINFASRKIIDEVNSHRSDAVRLKINGGDMIITGWNGETQTRNSKVLRADQSGLYFGEIDSPDHSINQNEFLHLQFDRDVLIHGVRMNAGKGTCGGFYRVGGHSPMAIYCVDADNDAKDQSGMLSDIGFVPAGTVLKLSSAPHWGAEPMGEWTLSSLLISTVEGSE